MQKDGWDTEPFELVVKEEKMFGRGATDDKGPICGWLNCIESFRQANVPIPINLKVTKIPISTNICTNHTCEY